MRFDAAIALEWAGTFGFDRRAGTEGERRAAEIVREAFERAGLRVEPCSVRGETVPGVLAWREVEPSPQVRVVFHTRLVTLEARRGKWLATRLVRQIARFGTGGEPHIADNRTGLGVLLELARTWPAATQARIETRFLVTGGRDAPGRAGRCAERDTIIAAWPVRPTLVVEWIAPGIGKELVLFDQGNSGLAASAAADLWIPHRVLRDRRAGLFLRRSDDRGPGYVVIGGGEITRPNDADQSIDQEALGRAAQLGTELALRWARAARSCRPSNKTADQGPA
jgi:hypothetical protein